MHRVAISSTGIFTPPEIITNEELVVAFNAYAALENAKYGSKWKMWSYDGGQRYQWSEMETLIFDPGIIRNIKIESIL